MTVISILLVLVISSVQCFLEVLNISKTNSKKLLNKWSNFKLVLVVHRYISHFMKFLIWKEKNNIQDKFFTYRWRSFQPLKSDRINLAINLIEFSIQLELVMEHHI